jgi:hypothetical protein
LILKNVKKTPESKNPPTLEIAMKTCVQDPTPRTAIMNGTSPKIRQNRSIGATHDLTKSDQLVTKYANIANICGHTYTNSKEDVCTHYFAFSIFHKAQSGTKPSSTKKGYNPKKKRRKKRQNVGSHNHEALN